MASLSHLAGLNYRHFKEECLDEVFTEGLKKFHKGLNF